MIPELIKIGEKVLNGNYSKKNILRHLAIKPKTEVINTNGQTIEVRPIIIDFNLNNHTVEIRRGIQLKKNEDYFIFPKISSNAKRVSLNANNYLFHIVENKKNGPTPIGIQKYVKENKIKLSKDFEELLNKLCEFYIEDPENKKRFILNPDKLSQEDKEEFNILMNDTQKRKTKESSYEEIYKKLITNKVYSEKQKNQIYAFIYLNGKSIFETKFAEEYINILYDAYISKWFKEKNARKNKVCYFCGKQTTVTNNVSTPFKIYNIDKPGFFENKKERNAYKSFSLCELCYIKLLVGINFMNEDLNFHLFNSQVYVLPSSDAFFTDFKGNLDLIKRIVEKLNQRNKKDQDGNKESKSKNIKDLVKKAKKYDFLLDFIFYNKNQQSLKVRKYLHDIELRHLINIYEFFDEVNSDEQSLLGNENINLFSLYNLLKDNNDKNISLFLDLLEAIYEKIPFNRDLFFEKFLKRYKSQFFKDKSAINYGNTIVALYMLDLLTKIKVFEVKPMEIEAYTKIKNEDLKEFFEKHEEINDIQKGLIILGYLIGKIVFKQRKDKKTSTFLSKISYDGTDKNDLLELMNETEEYFTMYKKDIFDEPDLNAYAFEVLSKYISNKDIKMNPAEVTFYILLGVELEKYIGNKHSNKGGNKNE